MSPIAYELAIAFFTIGSGIVCAGLVSSFYQLLTNHFPKFSMIDTKGVQLFTNLFIIALSGPVMILRNSYNGRVLEGRPMGYVFAGSVIAACWGMVNGVYILKITLNLLNMS